MPVINAPIDPAGCIIQVAVHVSKSRADALTAAGRSVPNPLIVRALLDTGASSTCIDPAVAAKLGLTPTGTTMIHTATPTPHPTLHNLYDVNLILVGPVSLTFGPIPVAECDISAIDCQMLLGRDVLQYCCFTYNGRAKLFTLAF
jgi:hypothetical protein